MRLSADDIERDGPRAPDLPSTRSWRIELSVALVGLLAGLTAVLWLLA